MAKALLPLSLTPAGATLTGWRTNTSFHTQHIILPHHRPTSHQSETNPNLGGDVPAAGVDVLTPTKITHENEEFA